MQDESAAFVALTIVAVAALLSATLIVALSPLLARYAVAKPNARSSHTTPTPQGGGIVVIGTTIAVTGGMLLISAASAESTLRLAVVFLSVILMAGVGVVADKRPIGAAPRLVLQTFAVIAVLSTLPSELRLLPVVPWWIERIVLLTGTLWFINLVNFMDGLDLMTVAEVVPITATLGITGLLGILPWPEAVISFALCGAMIGFAVFNRPIAKLFLGDVGSLPIGLLLGWLLLLLAGNGGHAAAILLPLYYLADSTITLLRRAANREAIWRAHRSHFYQRATDRGFRVIDVVARVFAVNVALALMALATIVWPEDIVALSAGVATVAWLLITLARGIKPA
jgi:UDP-N-acetylmuramyl pentapeptide phosphotransferase/UDP-N-acetylglucosamine-1-phosphate transferase